MTLKSVVRMAKKFNLPLTYAPKIAGVLDGTIRQTIRPGWKFMVGDLVSFHGWVGRPYHSKWSFRTEYRPLVEVVSIEIEPRGFVWMSCDGRTETDRGAMYSKWDELDRIAHLDGIDPPTGQALKTVLLGMHPIRDGENLQAQIIRW
jgi:hypothetical protein